MGSPVRHPPDQSAVVDVTSTRLIDLIHNRDPELAASVQGLYALLTKSSEILQGWQSAIQPR
jgi:hypothetical protein